MSLLPKPAIIQAHIYALLLHNPAVQYSRAMAFAFKQLYPDIYGQLETNYLSKTISRHLQAMAKKNIVKPVDKYKSCAGKSYDYSLVKKI